MSFWRIYRIGHVADDRLDLAPVGGDLVDQFPQSLFAPGDDHQLRPLPGEFPGQRAADPAGSPRDNRPAALEIALWHGLCGVARP